MKLKGFLQGRFLTETVKKINNRYYIYSHIDPKKQIGRKKGYMSSSLAIASILGMKSKGGFYNKSLKVKKAIIKSYKRRHGIK